MNIIFFYRNIKSGFSIHKVFNTIAEGFSYRKDVIIKLEVPFYGAGVKSIVNNLLFIYRNRSKEGINHITGDIHYGILALIGCKSILTIHDLVLMKNTKNLIKKKVLFFFWFYLPIKLATEIVCISESTKKDLLKYINRKDIKVIYNPIDASFSFFEKEFNSKSPIILHIGTGWNKNLTFVIISLKDIKCHLRIIGKITAIQLQLLKEYKTNYSNGFKLTDLEILEEYKNCDIVSFPSVFEGFGMPIIEGQAIGRVVLTSNISPMNEISNNSVLYVNPHSVASITQGFIDLINKEDVRAKLIRLGLENVKQLKAFKIAQDYRTIYKNIL
jgi:glycosyltransferase involved in cell wall biosynthesis